LELKQLEAFVKVYELQNFSKAADELFLSQPSISAYINALEKEVGSKLIHRSTKTFQATKSGTLLYEYAKEILSLHDKGVAALKNLSENNVGTIDILASSVPAQYILPEVLGAFHCLHPNVTFNITQMDSAEVINGIMLHKGEIGFVGALIDNAKCEYQHFMSEKLVLIAPNHPRFELINAVNIFELFHSEYFIAREIGSATRLEYEAYLKAIGVSLREMKISACLNNTQSIIQAVANGLGLAFVSSFAAKEYIQQKLVLSIDVANLPKRDFYIVQKKDSFTMPSVETLIEFILSYANKMQ